MVFLLVMGCLALIGFGTYVYVQDSNDSSLAGPADAGRTAITLDGQEQEAAAAETPDQKFEEFNNRMESGVKTNLSEEKAGSEGIGAESADSRRPAINVSFSVFSESRNSFSAGLVIVNDLDREVASCSLTIEARAGQVSAQEDNIAGQHGVSGCRFDNIPLSGLSDPGQTNPWKVVIQGIDANDQAVATLRRDLISASDLNNLVNDSSGVGRVL